MTTFLSRREFLAGVVGVSAVASSGRPDIQNRGRGRRGGGGRQSGAVLAPEEPQLWLPATGGQGTGVRFENSPDWARDTPGWYIPSTVSAGAPMLQFPQIEFLPNLIHSFRDLPTLLTQARSIGTSSLYLVDWFDGQPGARPPNYWTNKGDYVPRADLGGESALKDGIAAVHAQGGHVILYMEGFIVIRNTHVGTAHGSEWAIVFPPGPQPYPEAWKPCPGTEGWLSYVEGCARRIGGYGADGIFFDSQGFQKDWKCMAARHGHRPGDPEVFNRGCAELLRRARAALRQANPDAILLIEGPTMPQLFEHVDGSFEWSIDTFVRRWLWDDQGKTDTITSSYSLDDWNQIVAIGGKLGCGAQFLKSPPGASAQEFLQEFRSQTLPEKPLELQHIAQHAFWGLHAWRNAGLILGLRMPGLDDVIPRYWQQMEHVPDPFAKMHSTRESLEAALERLQPRAVSIDAALAGKTAPGPAEYVKTLLTARGQLAAVIDHDATVEQVRSPFPKAGGWRFTRDRATVLTAVNVADGSRDVTFPNAAGTWQDSVTGESFTARNGTLTIPVPAHRARLLHV